MKHSNANPAIEPLRPRVRIFQSLLVLAVFSLVPLWPAQAQATGIAVTQVRLGPTF